MPNFIATLIVGVLTVGAIVFAPIVALKLQKDIDESKELKTRQQWIFRTLLATRANILSIEHMQALNLIDLDFCIVDTVRDSWDLYRDHLNSYPNEQGEETQKHWEKTRGNYLTDLLYVMSSFLGYKFDKVILKNGAYFPVAHGVLNMEQALIRQGVVEIVSGKKSLKVSLEKPPE